MKPLSKDETRARRHEIHRRAMEGELKLPGAVRDMRNALGFTQTKFAKHFGLSLAHLSAVQLIGMSMVLLAIAGAAFLPKHWLRKEQTAGG